MSAKPRFKARVATVVSARIPACPVVTVPTGHQGQKLRVTDSRDLTAEKAVERVLQTVMDVLDNADASLPLIKACAYDACMSARVVNGKVRVRRAK